MTNRNSSFPESYRAYPHLRGKNWIMRPGSQYGVDFVAYRHHPALVHSEYAVLVLKDGDGHDINDLAVYCQSFPCYVQLPYVWHEELVDPMDGRLEPLPIAP
ncbi:hypothetical protein MLD38_021391 [Melastoma candidum]|uniref:Uncharacterized protein n=1 Tax=Melastoma candidum TaxID=119954 RepID=A0ACB9QJC1_9MYRT|nr:hypothetical protein MLD38_021391 [Melastoma candidum]